MKKALVVLLAVAMIFCFAATAMAATYTDMADQTDAAKDAVAFNSALGIIGGYPDGTFGPAKNITRAEFAKIAVNAAGLADSADYLKNTASKFSDVKVGAWYTGFINLAQSQGYLQGYPDGTFRPNATITNQEVVTVLLRMVGYNDNLTGPWPVDYINQAVKLDLLDDVNFVGAVPATRADVAVMTKATLDQKVVDWDKDKDAFVEATKGAGGAAATYSLLEDAFGASTVVTEIKVNGIAAGAATLDLGDAFTFDADDEELTLNTDVKDYVINADTAISDGLTFDQLAGHIVTVILNDATKKTENVAYIDVTSYTKTFKKVTTAVSGAAGKIGLDDKNYNVVAAPDYVAANFAGAGSAANVYFNAYFNEDDEIYAVINDGSITGADAIAVVEEVSAKGKFTVHGGNSLTAISDEADVMIIKNGAAAKLADIKEFDVVKQFDTTGADKIYFVSDMATAKLDRIYSGFTTLGGVKYVNAFAASDVFDADGEDASLKDYLGEEVKYVLNAKNQIEAIYCGVAVTSTTIKGVITDYATSDGDAYSTGGTLKTITVFKQDGTTATYNVDDKEYKIATGDVNTVATSAAAAITIGSYVEFSVGEDNNIKTAKTPATIVSSNTGNDTVDDEKYRITLAGAKYNVPEKAVIFNLYLNDDDELEVELLKRADIIDGTSLKTTTGFTVDAAYDFKPANSVTAITTDNNVDVLVLMDANATSGTKYAMIEDLGWLDADGYAQVKLYGDAKEYTVWGADAAASVTNAGYLAEDEFYAYTLSGDTITFYNTTVGAPASPAVAVAGPGENFTVADSGADAIKTIASGLVTMNSSGDQGEITDDTVILNVVFYDDDNNAGTPTVIDEINVWDEADLDEAQKVYYEINTDEEFDYIIVVTIK